MNVGRPSIFSEGIADAICERIASGESLRSICDDDAMPSQSGVFKWLRDNAEFAQQYARAREAQADALFDDILDIADDARNDWMERLGDEEKPISWQVNGEHIQRAKLRVDARKWMASKLAPKKYGEKMQLAGDGGGPLQINVVRFADSNPT